MLSLQESPDPKLREGVPFNRKGAGIFAVIIMAFLAMGILHYRKELDRIRQEQYLGIAAVGELKSGQIDQWRFERKADAMVIAKDPFLVRAVGDFRRDTAASDVRGLLMASLGIRVNSYRYSDILLLERDGTRLLSISGSPDSLDPVTQRALKDAEAGPEAVISDFYRVSSGFVHVDVAAAMRDTAGKILAIVVLRNEAEAFFDPLLRFWPLSSRSAETVIIQERDGSFASLSGGRDSEGGLVWIGGPLSSAPPTVRAVMERLGLYDGEDERGERVIADLRTIPNSGWRIVTKADAGELLAEGEYRAVAIGVIVGGFILLSAAAVAFINRRRVAALYKDRYLSERKQRESQEERRTLLYSIGDGVITTDTQGRVREMNPVAADLTGWTEGEARGRRLEEVFRVVETSELPALKGRDRMASPVEQAVLVGRAGSERRIGRNAAPIRDLNGEVSGAVLVFSDQTIQHDAHKALLASEAKFRSVLESVGMIGVMLDPDGNVTLCSDHLLEITGWTRAEVIGRNYFERFIPDEPIRKILLDFFRGIFTTGTVPSHFDNEIVTRKGARRMVTWRNTILRDYSGKIIELASLGEDITDRRLAEAKLQQSEQRLLLLIEHCPGAIAMFDQKMRYLIVSPRWVEDYHLQGKDVIGKSHYEVFPDIPDRWKEIHRRCLAGAVEKCEEDPFPRADGSCEWVRWEIHPWHDSDEGVGGIVMFTEVVTPRKKAQEALHKLNLELEQRVLERTDQLAAKNRELETFSYSVSHDLKAPLRGIDGYSKILLDEYADKIDEEGRTFLRNIRTGADQMRQLIEDMLAYSKLERRTISLGSIGLRKAVERILQEREFDLGKARIEVGVAPGEVAADLDGLSMVLRNLIDNAVKFSRLRNPPEITIRSRVEGGRHILSVKDNGTGFSMKHHDTIFQIFQRLHRAEDYGGTGVGLAIVKKAMDRMEGRVWAESEQDKGATFFLDLPCAAAPA